MAYRLIDPQVLLNKLLKTRTFNSAVEVINNNLSDRRLGEKTPEASRRTPLLNEGYGLLLNNSNSPFTPRGFESVAPVNSPDIHFEPPPVLKGAFTETVQTRPKIMRTIPPLPKLANLPPRPKAADPRGRRRPDIAIEETISQESLELEEECLKIVSAPTVEITSELPKMKMTKSSQLRKLVTDASERRHRKQDKHRYSARINLPSRPKATNPRGRRRPDIAIKQIEDTISQESLELEEECLKIVSAPTVEITSELPKMKMTKSSQLRKLVSDFRMRPSTAQHSEQRAAHLEQISTIPEQSSNKRGRPRGAHHRNHPMFIPN
ncbi:hypothetical protein ACHWQZ_G010213 [Mnemiopsis leidyi]